MTYWRWSNFRQCAIELCVCPRHPLISPRSKCISLMWQLQQKPYKENMLLSVVSVMQKPKRTIHSWTVCDTTQALHACLLGYQRFFFLVGHVQIHMQPHDHVHTSLTDSFPPSCSQLTHKVCYSHTTKESYYYQRVIIFSTNVWIALPQLDRACSWLKREICWCEF